MKKMIKEEEEISESEMEEEMKPKILRQNMKPEEINSILAENRTLKEMMNLKNEAYFRLLLLNKLDMINQSIQEMSLEDEESSEEEIEPEEDMPANKSKRF
jgi:hypothetical protein